MVNIPATAGWTFKKGSFMEFGEYFRTKRLANEKSLRQFCLKHNYDPGNISKLERGVLTPPHSEEKLADYAKALGIKKTSEEYKKMRELALEANREAMIPSAFRNISDKKLIKKLPLLFRTLDNSSLTEEKLDTIIKQLSTVVSGNAV